jgi:hypothetical protein
MIDVCKQFCFSGAVKADLRISIKDYHRGKSVKILLFRPPFPSRGFMVEMNGEPWPKRGGPVWLSRLMAAVRKSLVKGLANSPS